MARELFGTDGIRGKANSPPMTAELALRLGQAAALKFREKNSKHGKIKVVIGKDTRLSGYVFEFALTAGLCSMGADVYLVGPIPTPAIAHLTRSFAADFGIVISASHNPAEDNGIKFFDRQGYKLPDELEEEIEQIVLSGRVETEHISGKQLGKAYRINDAQGRYIEFAKGSVSNISLAGLKIVLDCANGAAYRVAPMIFSELGADMIVMNNQPDGLNINSACGALHPQAVRSAVLSNNADVGIALDGDADRVIMVDETGEVVDGDHMLAISALSMKGQGMLHHDTVVATVMSNIGFENAMKESGISVIRTQVGDRYVIDEMRKGNYNLGGEQSGHIIFHDFNSTGDGTISALQIISILKQSGRKLSELKQCMKQYPQMLENLKVKEKRPIESLPSVNAAIKSAEAELGSDGRVLVRYSGTENKIRVMVEGPTEQLVKKQLDTILDAARKELG